MSDVVRVRFAPSPTGHLHIGNARTAILNWIFARHCGGVFVVRIEDTDAERSSEASEKTILQDLRWLGLDWDEGPQAGGAYGPYRQSERLDLYRQHATELIGRGAAFYCYCTPDELEASRQAALAAGKVPVYDGRCRALTAAQRSQFESEGRQPVVRLHVPDQPISFADLVRGEVTFPAGDTGDFVLLRADRTPTYNFAVVIDDHLMHISHVIRGDDHVSNTPRQVALYQAFGWKLPLFAHIPMILGPDRTRLSKRHGATSVDMYARQGFLPDALFNFLSLLGWSSESGDEILSRERLAREFDFSRVSKSAAIFDVTKLRWMNGMYIRELDLRELTELSLPYLQRTGQSLPRDRETLMKLVSSVQRNLEVLEDVVDKTAIYFSDDAEPENEEAAALMTRESTQKVFWSFLRQAALIEVMTVDIFRNIMKVVGKETGVMGKELWMPVRVALTGQLHGPELPMVAEIFGREKCVARIRKWIIE